MILQFLPSGSAEEGMAVWVIVVTVLATIGIAVLRSIVGAIVEFFLVKKDESSERAKEEVRRFSMVFFFVFVGVLLIIFQDSVALFINKPSQDVAFAGFLTLIFSILIAGLTYRTTAKKVVDRVRR